MNNNDILRRVRYIFAFNDKTMVLIFNEANHQASIEDITAWLKQDNMTGFKTINDKLFATFLNGLINFKRGKKEGAEPTPEKVLNNNIVFMKIKIACNLKAEEVLEILSLADFKLSKHELSAFFRKPDHKHFRECKDQVLRNFLTGLQEKYRK